MEAERKEEIKIFITSHFEQKILTLVAEKKPHKTKTTGLIQSQKELPTACML